MPNKIRELKVQRAELGYKRDLHPNFRVHEKRVSSMGTSTVWSSASESWGRLVVFGSHFWHHYMLKVQHWQNQRIIEAVISKSLLCTLPKDSLETRHTQTKTQNEAQGHVVIKHLIMRKNWLFFRQIVYNIGIFWMGISQWLPHINLGKQFKFCLWFPDA